MSDSPNLDFSRLVADWQQHMAAARKKYYDKFQNARRKICSVLSELGVNEVVIRFDGEGDDGQVTGTQFSPCKDAAVAIGNHTVPGTEAERTSYDDSKGWVQTNRCATVDELLDDLCYALLEYKHPGWEINEGAHGTVTIDVVNNKCRLVFHRHIVECDSSEEVF